MSAWSNIEMEERFLVKDRSMWRVFKNNPLTDLLVDHTLGRYVTKHRNHL